MDGLISLETFTAFVLGAFVLLAVCMTIFLGGCAMSYWFSPEVKP